MTYGSTVLVKVTQCLIVSLEEKLRLKYTCVGYVKQWVPSYNSPLCHDYFLMLLVLLADGLPYLA